MTKLEKYSQLLKAYDEVISKPDWCEQQTKLSLEMGELVGKMTNAEKARVIEMQQELYQRRIKG